jgi:hypothetical protein
MSQSTPSVPAWKTEFEKRVTAFAENAKIDPQKAFEVFAEDFGADGSDERSLRIIESDEACPFGDLRQYFIEKRNLTKIGLLRLGIPYLRSSKKYDNIDTTNAPTSDSSMVSTLQELLSANKPIHRWTDRELIHEYPNNNPDVTKELNTRARVRPFLIWNPDGTLDEEASYNRLQMARKQIVDDIVMVNGSPRVAYMAGTFFDKPVDECPLLHGKILENHFCAQTGTDWTGVPTRIRQMVRVLVDLQRGRVSLGDAKALCQAAHEGEAAFLKAYPMVLKTFEQLDREEKLPRLKISPDAIREQVKIDRAFV